MKNAKLWKWRHFNWRNFNASGAVISALLWIVATDTNWISSIKFLSHISMATMVFTFVAAWRADVPTDEEVAKVNN